MHTPHGAALLRNFVRKIAGARGDWTMRAFKDERSKKSASKWVAQGDSAGCRAVVDSSVAAVLIHEAIGDQLTCVFVDHGCCGLVKRRRSWRCFEVITIFRSSMWMHRNISSALAASPTGGEAQDIGRLFHRCVRCGGKEDRKGWTRAGGISRAGHALSRRDRERFVHRWTSVTIKSHHNVGGLPARMNMKLVEPLRELFKDEVRALGASWIAGCVRRQASVPGPGSRSAVRVRSHTKARYPAAGGRNLHRGNPPRRLYDDIWQAFAVILPVKTVGVMGDGRTYDFVVGLRAVQSTDGMTADFYQFDMKFLGRVATRIINEVKGVNRWCTT